MSKSISWKAAFSFFLWVTFTSLPLMVCIQLYFTWDSISFAPHDINNWVYAFHTYNTPVKVFTGFVAITTLLGLKYRANQTSLQLNLYEKKENFILYLEHEKHFSGKVEAEFLRKKINDSSYVNFRSLYINLFPTNSPEDGVRNFDPELEVIEELFSPILSSIKNCIQAYEKVKLDPFDNKAKGAFYSHFYTAYDKVYRIGLLPYLVIEERSPRTADFRKHFDDLHLGISCLHLSIYKESYTLEILANLVEIRAKNRKECLVTEKLFNGKSKVD